MMSLLSVPISFKEVSTSNVRNFRVNPNWTITQFIQSVGPLICREFNIEEGKLEIIEAGQYTAGIRPESAPALNFDSTKIKDKWGIKLQVAFYIRRKDYLYPEMNLNLLRQSSIPTVASIVDDCPICFETISLTSRHSCSHRICDRCHQHCLSISYTICPLCRQP